MRTIEDKLERTLNELHINDEKQEVISPYLMLLRMKDKGTYEHSLRVSEKAKEIASFLRYDEKAVWYCGLLHDIGKIMIDKSLLVKNGTFDEEDYKQMKNHPYYGYKMLQDIFGFSAEVILRHHRYQKNKYPEYLPKPIIKFSDETMQIIEKYAKIIALADFYDALISRKNDAFSEEKSRLNLKEIMLKHNVDNGLIESLYAEKIFT